MWSRRRLILATLVASAGGLAALAPADADAGPRARRKVRRRIRRRVRRRHRRRVVARVVAGRRHWVVPVALAVGWELAHEDRVVVVQRIEVVEVEGVKTEVAVVVDASGATEEIPVVREDDGSNGKEEQGSVLPDGDESTPGLTVEEEVEVEVEE